VEQQPRPGGSPLAPGAAQVHLRPKPHDRTPGDHAPPQSHAQRPRQTASTPPHVSDRPQTLGDLHPHPRPPPQHRLLRAAPSETKNSLAQPVERTLVAAESCVAIPGHDPHRGAHGRPVVVQAKGPTSPHEQPRATPPTIATRVTRNRNLASPLPKRAGLAIPDEELAGLHRRNVAPAATTSLLLLRLAAAPERNRALTRSADEVATGS